jgi:hypothetical protein
LGLHDTIDTALMPFEWKTSFLKYYLAIKKPCLQKDGLFCRHKA